MSVVSSPRRQKSWQIAAEVVSLLGAMEEKQRSLGERLRTLSRAKGLESDEDAARFLKMSYRQYQRWLAGDSEPRVSSLKRVADKYGVPITELVDLPEPAPDRLKRIEDALSRLVEDHEAFRVEVARNALEVTKRLDAMRPPATPPRRRQQP